MIELARVKRNGADTIRKMVDEFRSQSTVFDKMSINDMIENLRSYKRFGWFTITETELILMHDCN